MRPKVVILTLVAAFGLLGMIAVLKGLAVRHAGDSGNPGSGMANAGSPSAGTNAASMQATGTSGSPVVSDEMRAVLIAKELDRIQELQSEADGSNNPVIIQALLVDAAHPEAEVRKAAVEALRELNDTNAIPGMQKLADGIQDAREKVAVLDAIDYLKLPDILPDNVPPDTSTNAFIPSRIPPDQMNAEFMHQFQKKPRHKVQQTASQDTSVPQPQ